MDTSSLRTGTVSFITFLTLFGCILPDTTAAIVISPEQPRKPPFKFPVSVAPKPLTEKKPAGWPPNKRWRPTRFWGPFHEGSDFSQIKLIIKRIGTSGPEFGMFLYFNDYFLTHEDPADYRQYFAPPLADSPMIAPLPNEANGASMRLTAGPTDENIVFVLTDIRPTSSYGGSIRLQFVQEEQVGFEVVTTRNNNQGGYLWDLSGMTADIYLRPDTSIFNKPVNAPTDGILWGAGTRLAVQYNEQKAYVSHQEVAPESSQSVALVELRSVIDKINSSFVAATPPSACRASLERFVMGWMHSQFGDDVLTPSLKVTSLPIEEGLLGPPFVNETRAYYSLEVRVYDITSDNREVMEGPAYYESKWFWHDNVYELGKSGYRHCNGRSISWISIGTHYIDPEEPGDEFADYCDVFRRIEVDFYGIYEDPMLIDGSGMLHSINLSFLHDGGWWSAEGPDPETAGTCDLLRSRARARQPGIIKEIVGKMGSQSGERWKYDLRHVLYFR